MIFDLNKHTGRNLVMRCPTQESADIFCEFLNMNGKRWSSGRAYTESEEGNHWEKYRENTCYRFNAGHFADYEFYRTNGFEILEFEDFKWDKFEDKFGEDDGLIDDFLQAYSK